MCATGGSEVYLQHQDPIPRLVKRGLSVYRTVMSVYHETPAVSISAMFPFQVAGKLEYQLPLGESRSMSPWGV